MITIELTNDEATLFKAFRQYQDDFTRLQDSGLFALESGKVIINRANGQIQNIMVEKRMYTRSTFPNK